MTLFSKRETPIQNIAYMALMSAINIVFVLITNALPILLFLLVFILPLTSTIVTIYCQKKYYPIYFVVTLALSILVSYGFSIFDTLVYILPALITGFIFGLSYEYKLPMILTVVVNTVLEFLLSLLTFYVLGNIIANLNMMDTLINFFGLNSFPYKMAFSLIFLYIIAQIQILISYIFIKSELKRLNFNVNLDSYFRWWQYIFTFICLILSVFSYLYFKNWTIVLTLMPLTIYVYELVELLLLKDRATIVMLVISHIAFIFTFGFFYSRVASPNQFILIYSLFALVTIIDFLSNYCFHRNVNNIK